MPVGDMFPSASALGIPGNPLPNVEPFRLPLDIPPPETGVAVIADTADAAGAKGSAPTKGWVIGGAYVMAIGSTKLAAIRP